MTEYELEKQKLLVKLYLELEEDIKATRSKTWALGWKQRNALYDHVEAAYTKHEELNSLRNQWDESMVRSKVLDFIRTTFVQQRDMFGYFENPEIIYNEIKEILDHSIKKEEYIIAKILNEWLSKWPK